MNAFFETTNGFNFQIIDPLIESRAWFDCNAVQVTQLLVNRGRNLLRSAVKNGGFALTKG